MLLQSNNYIPRSYTDDFVAFEYVLTQENAFETVVCYTAAILSRPQCVNRSLSMAWVGGLHSVKLLPAVYFAVMIYLMLTHYDDVIMTTLASQITNLAIVYSIVYSDVDQRKHQSSASLAFVRGIHRGPVNSPHKWPVTRKMFPFDHVIMSLKICMCIIKIMMPQNHIENFDCGVSSSDLNRTLLDVHEIKITVGPFTNMD